MAKAKKEIDVPVRVSLDTSQIVDLSAAVESFVDGLATTAEFFAEDIVKAFRNLADNLADDCQDIRRNLPNLPTYTTGDDVDDDVACSPVCPVGATGCPCREAI